MSLIRSRPGAAEPVLKGARVVLRAPKTADYAAWSALRDQSRTFLEPWEPTWPQDDLTPDAFRRRLRRYDDEVKKDQTYPFFAFRLSDAALIGGLTLSNVRRGVTQSASLGYWMGAPYAGQGFMTEAVKLLLPHVFGTLGLHRLEAACIPGNEASRRVLLACGFREEGFARGYLKIAGRWRDHQLFAILEDDPRPA